MNKREREKAEREKLKQMMNNNPKLLAFLESAVDKSNNQDLKALIEPVLADTFEKSVCRGFRLVGIPMRQGVWLRLRIVRRSMKLLKSWKRKLMKLLKSWGLALTILRRMLNGNTTISNP